MSLSLAMSMSIPLELTQGADVFQGESVHLALGEDLRAFNNP